MNNIKIKKFSEIEQNSEPTGIQLFKTNNPTNISLNEILDKFEIQYDKTNDIINIKCKSNILIEAENTLLISKNDTVILSGDALGINDGKIFLNPTLQAIKTKIKKIKEKIITTIKV